jgi:hypothetical protein
VKLITHFHVMWRLRLCGSIPLLPQYVLMTFCLIKQGLKVLKLKDGVKVILILRLY